MSEIVDEHHKLGREILSKIEGKAVFDLLNELNFVSNELSEFIVSFAYGQIFPLPHLDLKTKELLILAMLLSKGNADAQLKVHLKSALNTGNSFQEIEELIQIFTRLTSPLKRLIFCDLLEIQKNTTCLNDRNIDQKLNVKNTFLIQIAILSALGNNEEILTSIIKEAINNEVNKEEINEVMLLLIPYCGFPNSINGTLILKQALIELSTKNK
jgi:4-carboxymuconolactone decarboxylase